MLALAPLLLLAASPPRRLAVLSGRNGYRRTRAGPGRFTCATAFMPENRAATTNWVAGFWAAWDMSQIGTAPPIAAASDLNGIVGEVEMT